MFDSIVESLSTNAYFGAGAGLAGIGIAMAMARRSLMLANTLLRRRLLITLQGSNEDA